MIHAGGPLDRDEVTEHLEFAAAAGWNGVWVPPGAAGTWADGEPSLLPATERLLAWCRDRGLRPIVALAPVAESGGPYRYSDPAARARLLAWAGRLAARGVRDVALDFQRAPRELSELSDVLEYGRDPLVAQAALARAVADAAEPGTTVWLAPGVFSDVQLRGDDDRLAPLRALPPSVGLVWAGPAPVAATIDAGELRDLAAAVGERPLMLQDRYPHNFAGARLPTAVPLGALRGRDAAVARAVDAWLTMPSHPLPAARLPLLTVADYLLDPDAYDPDAALEAAARRLAGDDEAALEALRTQALEWGGWIGERNYRTALTDNPVAAAASLRDPAASALWVWTVRRYPDRMAALDGLADRPFAAALHDVMDRRLAIARAMPTVRDLRGARGEREALLLERLRHELTRADERSGARDALRRFLDAAGLGDRVRTGPAGPG